MKKYFKKSKRLETLTRVKQLVRSSHQTRAAKNNRRYDVIWNFAS